MMRIQDANASQPEETRNIHHDIIVEKLEIARTIGLVTDYEVDRIGPPRQPGASVTVRRSASATDGGVESYLASLLNGVVPAENIVVTPPLASSGPRPEEPPQPSTHPADEVGSMRYALSSRTVPLHSLAAAGAMLTCIAVVLNVGPFGKAPKVGVMLANSALPQIQAFAERPSEFRAVPQPAIDERVSPTPSQSATAPEEVPEPLRAVLGPSPFSLPAIPAAFRSSSPGDEGGIDRPDPWSVNPPAQSNPDRANAERAAIVGVWAPDKGTCSARDFQGGLLPTVINNEGAWAGDTFCLFTNKRETETGWSVVAKCSTPRERWTSVVRLTVNENRLTWASRRGTQAYTRCAPDVLMAQAR